MLWSPKPKPTGLGSYTFLTVWLGFLISYWLISLCVLTIKPYFYIGGTLFVGSLFVTELFLGELIAAVGDRGFFPMVLVYWSGLIDSLFWCTNRLPFLINAEVLISFGFKTADELLGESGWCFLSRSTIFFSSSGRFEIWSGIFVTEFVGWSYLISWKVENCADFGSIGEIYESVVGQKTASVKPISAIGNYLSSALTWDKSGVNSIEILFMNSDSV